MERKAPIALVVFGVVTPILALTAPAAAQGGGLDDQQQLGSRLFNQSCVVCHLKQQIGTTTYAPALSKDTLGGKANVIHDVIENGTPHMPSFKIQFSPPQIDAIVAYIKTVPEPTDNSKPRTPNSAGDAD